MIKLYPAKFNSIKYKFLLATFLFVVIFTIIILFFWYSTTKNDAELSAKAYMSEILGVSNNNLEVALKDINSIISVISVNSSDFSLDSSDNRNLSDILKDNVKRTELEQYQDNKDVSDLLTKLSLNKYYLNGITISNFEDKYYSAGITMLFKDIKSQPWYDEIKNSHGEKIFIPPHFYSIYNSDNSQDIYKDKVFSYAKAIISEGTVIGFVIADIRCEILNDIFNRNIKDKGYIYIADGDLNELIYTPPADNIPSLNNKAVLLNILKSTTGYKSNFYMRIGQENNLVIFTKSSFSNWTTIGIIPEDILLGSFYNARNYMLILTAIFCILAFTILFLICTLLTRNILKLNKAVSEINKDNLELSACINSNDEVGQLYFQINSMVFRIKNLIEDVKKIEKEKISTEIKFLQSQINPHFLYNTLNTIKFISSLHGVENIKKIAESLSILLHVNMDSRTFISISEEIGYIQSYLGIQEFKYTNVKYNIMAEDDIMELMTLKLLLQPIVENSLIHGVSKAEGNGIVNIKLYRADNCLKMRVQDNGIGISSETIAAILENKIQSHGIGLNNIISRIRMYFGNNYGISITSQQNLFTAIEITLPVISRDEVGNYA